MGGVIRAAMNYGWPNSENNACVNVIHVAHLGVATIGNTEVDAVNTMLKDWWNTGVGGELSMKSYASTDCKLLNVSSQVIEPGPPLTPRILTVDIAGTLGGDPLPPQVAVVLSWRTGTAGRSFRGRTYFPGATELMSSGGGAIPSVDQQNIADRASGLITAADALFGGDGKLVVWSRKLGQGNAITSVRVGNRFDTQRRRKIRDALYVTGS